MHTRPLDEKEKIVTGPRVAWLPPYIYIRVCMPALAQEGGGGDAGGDGGLGWVGREGGETEQNVI